ncbi:hypothetical protein SC206_16650 [Rouxiella sp. T17]|uniref:hypothetical protein n=1 Tax=Rouxiella sp. T17 TaxID=3085684 RepID=UPI002FCC6FE5
MPNNIITTPSIINRPLLISNKHDDDKAHPLLKFGCLLKTNVSDKQLASNKNLSKIDPHDWQVIDEHIKLIKGEPQNQTEVCQTVKQVAVKYAPYLLGLSLPQSSPLTKTADVNHVSLSPSSTHSSLPSFRLNMIYAAATQLGNAFTNFPQWPPAAHANPITSASFLEHKPSDSLEALKLQLAAFQLTSATDENKVLIDYLKNKHVLLTRDDEAQSKLSRNRRELDDGQPRTPWQTMVIVEPKPQGETISGTIIRWGDKRMDDSKLLFKMAWQDGIGGLALYLGSGLVAMAGSLAQTVGKTLDGTIFEKMRYETPGEWLMRLTNNFIMPPEAAAARAFKIAPVLSHHLRTIPTRTARGGVKVIHPPTGLTHISNAAGKKPALHIKVQDKFYPIKQNVADGTFSLSSGRKIYWDPRTGEWREFWSGNRHLTAKSMSEIPEALLSRSAGEQSVLAMNGKVSAEGKVWLQPETGKHYLEVLKRDPVNLNRVVSEYIEGHLEERFFTIRQTDKPVDKQTLLEWKADAGKWQVVAQTHGQITASVTSPIFKELPANALVTPQYPFNRALTLSGFKNVYRSENSPDIYIHTGNTRRGVAQYIKVDQAADNANRFMLTLLDEHGNRHEIRYYHYQEGGEFTLEESILCHRVKRADDNPCLAGPSAELAEPVAKRARIAPNPQQVVEQKLAEIESNALQLVPINRAGVRDLLHDVAINSIREQYHQQVMNNVPIEQLTDIFKAQARTARIINEYYVGQPLKGAVAGAREYSYILLDKLLSSGAFDENLIVFDLTHGGESKHTALLYSPKQSVRKFFGTTAPFLDPHEYSALELTSALEKIQEPVVILNPWSANNKVLRFESGANPAAIKQKLNLMLQEAGVTIADSSEIMPEPFGQTNTLTLESLKLSLPESIADPLSSMTTDEKAFLNDLDKDNYNILARGEAVLNQPAGVINGEALTLRDVFNSATSIVNELDKLSGRDIRKFVKNYFGKENLPAKVDVFKRSIAHAKNNLHYYSAEGERLNKLVFVEEKAGEVVNPLLAFVSEASAYDIQYLSIVNHNDWKGTNIFYYVNSIQTLLHEISHIKESPVPFGKKALCTSDFIYNEMDNLEVGEGTIDFRMNYYSEKNNKIPLEEVDENHLELMNYNEFLLVQSEFSNRFRLIEDPELFEEKIRFELEKDIMIFRTFLEKNRFTKPSDEILRQSEHYINKFLKNINGAFKRVGMPQKDYEVKPLTVAHDMDPSVNVINHRAIQAIYNWIHDVAMDKERRVAVVLSNADSIADYQSLLAATNNLLAKNLVNKGVLHRPAANLPWEASDSDGSDSSSN